MLKKKSKHIFHYSTQHSFISIPVHQLEQKHLIQLVLVYLKSSISKIPCPLTCFNLSLSVNSAMYSFIRNLFSFMRACDNEHFNMMHMTSTTLINRNTTPITIPIIKPILSPDTVDEDNLSLFGRVMLIFLPNNI